MPNQPPKPDRLPEPEYRRTLRGLPAQLDQMEARLHVVRLNLPAGPVEAPTSPAWAVVPGLNGLETRAIPGAFVLDTRGAAGVSCDDVAVPEAIDLYVKTGRLSLRRLDTEDGFTEYQPGEVIHLEPNERHAWVLLERCENRAVFVPAAHYAPA